ncbi:methanogenic corrinoid protein MtbC1 [Lentzea flaviverrucosa]|uniref:Methanogenic corrinoid protein MtbC1 n=1 Tax=Lentzea flaviverrucosa TaxID=200379 RepID=A0A1H9XEN3_9PSEU|nr:cobalamin B12-binding domain-containing protein [Lentzea flaviverrucosa]RDI21513.1 methanogenic corrinoid protein MtbC1 [Lentzea flaviverrucosa]SES44509.1 Methanogenic corrinoid protein MtbC1 [Lentzea flaviverrucosa]
MNSVVTTADALWEAAFAGDEHRAADVVLGAAAELGHETVLLEVIGAVQHRVGREWAANRISVAQEHAITAINDRAVTALSITKPRRRPEHGRVTVACVDGEWHALPARLLAEVLSLRGFAVDYLGAQVPTPHLITYLHRTGPDVVALSSSIATRLPVAHSTMTACQATGVPVMVGGAAFGVDGAYARRFGANAWAADARSAADMLLSRTLTAPGTPHQPVDDLPHLADQEYTLVSRTARALVRSVYRGLEERVPAMRSYSDEQRQHTAEDLAHIVDYLATALYVDDDALFRDFLEWTGAVLNARGVPAQVLEPALELLAAQLRDFPRAQRMLAQPARSLSA